MIGQQNVPTSQPISNKTKTNRALLARVFPRLAPVNVFASNSDWFIVLFTSVVVDRSNYFGFGFTALK